MPAKDLNDALRAGIAPPDPWVGAEDVPAATATAPKPAPRLDRLERVWRPLEGWGDWFNEEPPRRPYLLTGAADGKEDVGILPLGKVGMLAAAGSAGKSWLLTQLALAVATGRTWIGLRVAHQGRVMLALGEEDAEEVQRRLYYAAQVLKLGAEERTLAARRIWPLPLAGHSAALTTDGTSDYAPPPGREKDQATGLPVTDLYWELLERMERDAGDPWRLLVLDPMSRFAGAEVEKDSAAGTRFVQAVERFTSLPGNPTVLVSHHTNKTSRTEGQSSQSDAAAAGAARGSSALTDAVRWQANLESKRRFDDAPELVVLRVTKNNYGRYPSETWLVRDSEHHGAMRLAQNEEAERYRKAEAEARAAEKAAEKGTGSRRRSPTGSDAPALGRRDWE